MLCTFVRSFRLEHNIYTHISPRIHGNHYDPCAVYLRYSYSKQCAYLTFDTTPVSQQPLHFCGSPCVCVRACAGVCVCACTNVCIPSCVQTFAISCLSGVCERVSERVSKYACTLYVCIIMGIL